MERTISSLLQEVRTYSKYVFNDHLKFIFVFIIGAGAYYYQQWLQTLTPSFPTALVMAVLLGLVLTAGSIQTLLKKQISFTYCQLKKS